MSISNAAHPNLLYSDFTPKPCAFCKNLCCNLHFIYHQLEIFSLNLLMEIVTRPDQGHCTNTFVITFQCPGFKSVSLFDHSHLGELSTYLQVSGSTGTVVSAWFF